jgi:hypothetical protein
MDSMRQGGFSFKVFLPFYVINNSKVLFFYYDIDNRAFGGGDSVEHHED